MTAADGVVQATFADAASDLAGRVLTALHTDGELNLPAFVDASADDTAALAAVRLVGADIFVPYALLNRPLDTADARIVADSFAVFPAVGSPETPDQWVMAWRDWATVRLMLHLTGPQGGEVANSTPDPDSVGVLMGAPDRWQQWSVRAAQLSPLALSPLDTAMTAAVAAQPTTLALGATRAVLRRDYSTATRLARWIALLASKGVAIPLNPVLLVEHLRLHTGSGPRLLLDLAVARRMLGSGAA